jgi:PAS domain S-box-containing protein
MTDATLAPSAVKSTASLPTILLVDDQPARLLTYESILAGLSVRCVRATSGHEALQCLLAQEFAVIILDVNMPVMDGFEVARLVREHPRMERTPIIFVTGVHVSELDHLRGYEVGAIDYISVPVVPEILRSKVAILVELYQRRSELRTVNEALAEARSRLDRDHATALGRVAAAQRDSEQRLLIAHKAAQLGTHDYDLRTGEITWDARTYELWGIEPGTPVTYEVFASGIHPDDMAALEAALKTATRPGGDGEFFARYRVIHRIDRQVRWIEAIGLAIFAEGAPTRLVGTVQDVTQRLRAEAALLESEERFRSIFRDTGIGMVLLEKDCTIRMVNPAFCAITARTEQELLGTSCLSITHPDDLDENFLLIGRLLASAERSAQYEKRYVRPDGSARWVRINIVRHTVAGSEKLLGAVEDITERIEARKLLEEAHRDRQILLEAERSARNEAEAAMRAKDEFLATLSHELRTPLSNVVSWARVLQRKYASEHADLAKGLGIIVDNAMTQSQLISDLLDMSRIVAGKISLEATVLNVSELVARAVNAQQPTAEAKSLALVVDDAGGLGFVLGDETRLQQVLWNLLSNAIKFTPPHSAIPIRVSTRRTQDRVVISVADPGEGIDPRFLPHLFGRFRQGDGSRARRHGGLGLGLSIVKQLVEMHGGEVSARSPGLGQGATFTIKLPLYDADKQNPAPQAREEAYVPEAQPLAGRTILVVEDQVSILEHLKHSLEEYGAATLCVGSAQEALAVLRESRSRPVDLLVSDLGLPAMDGYQLIRAIRDELGCTPHALPAIAVSAFAREEDQVRSIVSGFQAHITKPYQVAHIVKTALTLLRKRNAPIS